MTELWWTCPRCYDRMATRMVTTDSLADLQAAEDLVATDRDRHIARQHPEVVHWAALMLTISRYRHLDCHN